MAGLALAGTVTTQAKARAPSAPLGHLALAGTVVTQAKARAVTSAAMTHLVGTVTTQSKARARGRSTNALVGTVTTQAKAQAFFRNISPPIYFDLATLMRDTPIGAIGSMDDDPVEVFGQFP